MNKIYKIIWSRTKNCYVVASELAKGQSRNKSVSAVKKSALTLGVTLALVGSLGVSGVQAATGTTPDTSTATGAGSLALANATANGAGAIALGEGASALGENIIAIGKGATAESGVAIGGESSTGSSAALALLGVAAGESSVAIAGIAEGLQALTIGGEAQGDMAHSFGIRSRASGESSLAMGFRAAADGANSIATGYGAFATGDDSIATGTSATASATNSMALGNSADASGEGSISLGTTAISKGTNDVAIGTEAVANGGIAILGKLNKDAEADTTEGGSLAILGAVTGSRSYTIGGQVTGSDSLSIGSNATVEGSYSYSIGFNSGVTADHSIAFGDYANALKNNAQAIGDQAKVYAEGGTAIGSWAEVSNEGTNAIAVGVSSVADKANSVALGANSKTNKDFEVVSASSEITKGTAPNSVTTTFGNFAGTAKGVVSVGDAGSERQIINVAPGQVSATSTDAINGSQLYAVADQVVQNAADIKKSNSTAESTATVVDTKGITFAGDSGTPVTKKLGEQIKVFGNASEAELTDKNIGVVAGTDGLAIKLSKNLDLTADGGLTVGTTTIKNNEVKAASTTINTSGITSNKFAITNGPSMDATGINAGSQKISGVAKGIEGTDAVNVDQLTSTVQSSVANVSFDFVGDVANADGGKTEFTRTNKQKITVTGGAKAVTAKSDLSEGNIGVVVDDSTGTLEVRLAKNINLGTDGKLTIGNTVIDPNGLAITNGPSITVDGINAGNKVIKGVSDAKNNDEAVNLGQLTTLLESSASNVKFTFAGDVATSGATDTAKFDRKSGDTIKITGGDQAITDTNQLSEGNIGVVVDTQSGELAVKLAKELNLTQDGSITMGKTVLDGNKLEVAGTTIDDNGISTVGGVKITKDGINAGGKRISGVADGVDDTDAVNVSQLRSELGTAVADVGLSFAGDAGETVKVTNGNTLTIYGGVTEADKLVDGNIGVIGTDKGLSVQLAKDLIGLDSVTTGNTTINNDGLTVKGKDGKDGAVITNDGLAIKGEDGKDKVVVKGDKVDMGGNVIHNVGAGEAPSDAVNRGQLDAVSDRVDGLTGDLGNLNGRVNKLNNRVNEVGAGAAALAALNPLDFNPDDKWNFAVGYGNYKNADAFAIGAYYQPNEDTRFSIGSTLGNGDEMINAGVSIRFGQSNGVSTSRVALAKDVESLKRIVQQLVAENEQLRRGGNGMTSGYPDISDRQFPDVPKNHWAYEYVDTITKKGFTIGYPDGEFKGDRTLTRYEFAAVVYRALKNGAEIDGGMARAIDEFGPELARLEGLDHSRVDRVAGEDNDRFKIERLRVNNKDNAETGDYRDIYGSKIQKEELAQ